MLQGTTQAVIFAGTPGADVAYGSSTNDNLSGAAANDELFGYAGNDTLNGGIGNDSLRGADGNDTFVFDSTIAGGLNVDQVFGFVDGADRLLLDRSVFTTVNALGTTLTAAELLSAAGATAATTAAQRLIHNVTTGELFFDADGSGTAATPVAFATLAAGGALTAGSIALQGVGPGQVFTGTLNLDLINGTNGADQISGLAGNDTLNGLGGDHTLNGGAGNDQLAGGLGNDLFVLDAALGATNIDTIADYTIVADPMVLDRSVFSALSGGTTLTAAEFRSGAGVTTANAAGQRITYNTSNGFVYYDADGSGAGAAPVAFAVLTGDPNALSAADFLLQGVSGGGGGGVVPGGPINGTAAADAITALGGNDTLNGGLGADRLTGGADVDTFRFDAALGAGNVDTIVDFTGGETVQLSRSVFSGFTANGVLTGTQFLEVRSTRGPVAATTGVQRILFDRDTGNVWYDADGNAAGVSPIQFATFTGFRAAAHNFTVVA